LELQQLTLFRFAFFAGESQYFHEERRTEKVLSSLKLVNTMGLWSSSDQPSPPQPKISSDGAPIAPDRSARAKCWEARDAYFKCLDNSGIVDSISEKDKAAKACAVEGKGFEANCASSWVSLFNPG
jgi:hypothetical protein